MYVTDGDKGRLTDYLCSNNNVVGVAIFALCDTDKLAQVEQRPELIIFFECYSYFEIHLLFGIRFR